MSILEERLPYLEPLRLEQGAHDAPNNRLVRACVMEAVAYVAGEPWSDSPECASPVLGAFLRSWNDSLSDEDRQMLKPLIPRLVGSKASKRVEEKRAWMATDWRLIIASLAVWVIYPLVSTELHDIGTADEEFRDDEDIAA